MGLTVGHDTRTDGLYLFFVSIFGVDRGVLGPFRREEGVEV